jgi:hypothetical protein
MTRLFRPPPALRSAYGRIPPRARRARPGRPLGRERGGGARDATPGRGRDRGRALAPSFHHPPARAAHLEVQARRRTQRECAWLGVRVPSPSKRGPAALGRRVAQLPKAGLHSENPPKSGGISMAVDDYLESEVAAAAAATAVLLSPRVRGVMRKGLVYGTAGLMTAGDAALSVAKGAGRGVQQAAGRGSNARRAASASSVNRRSRASSGKTRSGRGRSNRSRSASTSSQSPASS